LGHLARPLTPKSGAKAIVFLGRNNGLPWNAALDIRVGSNSEVPARNWEVRFALSNGHRLPGLSGPKSANGQH